MNQASKFTVHTKLSPHIGVLRIFPNITLKTVCMIIKIKLILLVTITLTVGVTVEVNENTKKS